MIKLLTFTASILFTCNLIAQNATSLGDDFKMLAMHNLNVNSSTISTFSSGNIKGTRYLFDQWTSGSVTTTDNITFSKNYLFNFDKTTQELYASYTDQGNLSVLLDKSKVRSFMLLGQTYINGKSLDPKGKDIFYQALAEDSSRISLYKQLTTTFVKGGFSDVSKVREGNTASEYVDNISYYVFTKGELKKVNLTENSIHKMLKDQDKKIDLFMDLNPNKDLDESLLVLLVKYLNQ